MKRSHPQEQRKYPQSPYSVLLADDHTVVRMGLKTLILNIDKTVQFQEASGGEEIIAKLRAHRFDLLIIDFNMRQSESFSLITYIRRAFPSLKVLIFTLNEEWLFAARFLKCGVNGYLHKQTDESEIIAAFDAMRTGMTYISNSLCGMISGRTVAGDGPGPFEKLTDREFEVILQIIGGNSAKEIAEMLHLNRSTVSTHKSRILRKLKVRNTVELLGLAKRHGIL